MKNSKGILIIGSDSEIGSYIFNEYKRLGIKVDGTSKKNNFSKNEKIKFDLLDNNYNLDLNKSVIVETRRGKISIKIRHDADLLPGMIFLPFCFKEAAANILTSSDLDPIGKIPELKFSAAKVYQV